MSESGLSGDGGGGDESGLSGDGGGDESGLSGDGGGDESGRVVVVMRVVWVVLVNSDWWSYRCDEFLLLSICRPC